MAINFPNRDLLLKYTGEVSGDLLGDVLLNINEMRKDFFFKYILMNFAKDLLQKIKKNKEITIYFNYKPYDLQEVRDYLICVLNIKGYQILNKNEINNFITIGVFSEDEIKTKMLIDVPDGTI
jgi:hypothetical protein